LPNKKTVIIVVGPTAVGKTEVAIELATHYKTSIISADSRQCYKELNIGVARPSEQELGKTKHYFIADHSIHEEVTAATFEAFALQKTAALFENNKVVVMVGGTGLYIKAFAEGLDKIPGIDPLIRENILKEYNQHGLAWLQTEIRKNDPQFYKKGENLNPQRMMRALEVVRSTGRSILDFRNTGRTPRDFDIIRIGLHLEKNMLHRNIHTRTDKMMEAGLLDEVKRLLPFKNLNALQTVGYKELFDHLEGKLSHEKAIELIKQNTRQYAKRQMTWFKKDKNVQWFLPYELNEILNFIAIPN
jgi:tRNA dimethylallyltransferase